MGFREWWSRTFKGDFSFDMPPLTPWQVKAETDLKIKHIMGRLDDLEIRHKELTSGGSRPPSTDRGPESPDSGSGGIPKERPDG